MRCCASPTTSTVDNAALAAIGVQLEGLLLEQILTPLEGAFGRVGGLPIALFAQAIAERDAHGFAAALKRLS